MGTRVKVFTDLLNLGHEKVTKTLWQVFNGNVRINVRFNVGIEEELPGVDVYDVP